MRGIDPKLLKASEKNFPVVKRCMRAIYHTKSRKHADVEIRERQIRKKAHLQ